MNGSSASPADAGQGTAPAAYCQQCGRPLSAHDIRAVSGSIFCEPCLAARLAGLGPQTYAPAGEAWTDVSSGASNPSAPFAAGAPRNLPHPGVAALLGLIPGVGAMYNEQYAKGLVHLIVFAVLVSLSNANGIFGLFVCGWVAYMAIEAHHTARARRDGTPQPNPFGLNDIGERFGFGRSWLAGPGVASVAQDMADAITRGAAGYRNQAAAPGQPAPPNAGQASPAGPPVPDAPAWGAPTDHRWATSPPAASAAQPASSAHAAYARSGYPQQPATEQPSPHSVNVPFADVSTATVSSPPQLSPAGQSAGRFPMAAVWLIGLGLIFMLSNIGLLRGLPAEALAGVVVLAAGVPIFLGRLTRSATPFSTSHGRARTGLVLLALRPAIMPWITGVLLILDGYALVRWGKSWPLFVIGAGVLLLLQRVGDEMVAAGSSSSGAMPDAEAFTGPVATPAWIAPATPAGHYASAPDAPMGWVEPLPGNREPR